jgi:hypothetical protein
MIRRSFFLGDLGRASRLMLLASTATLLACSQTPEGRPPVYPIKGKVLYKGKPITGGTVVFERDGGDPPESKAIPGSGPFRATGRIEADGSFGLQAFPDAEGVPAGWYKVGISSIPPRSEGNLLDAAASAQKGNPDVLRGRYADPKTSGLRAQVVKDQANEPRFDLK